MLEIEQIIIKVEENFDHNNIDQILLIFNDLYPSDIAEVIDHTSSEYRLKIFQLIIDQSNLSTIISECEQESLIDFFSAIKEQKLQIEINVILNQFNFDDIVEILSYLPADFEPWILSHLSEESRLTVSQLLGYQEGQAGRIMSTEFFSINENTNVFDTFNILKGSHDAEMVYYIYIVDSYNHLVGVVSLRDLITKKNDKTMKEIMISDIISVHTSMDQEEVARKVERYNLAAIPVVNSKNRLVGIITVDDVIDIIREETTEDIMKLAGTNEEEFTMPSPLHGFLRRMPWLLVSFFGGLLTVLSMSYFAHRIDNVILLAFVPIIAGMGGNIGSQSSTIVVRGLAIGKIITSELLTVLWREISTALLLGLFFGCLLGIVAEIKFSQIYLIGVIVALGMLFSMIIAAAIGSCMPILFNKFKIDPAVATGPFVSTAIDNIGLLGYLMATVILMDKF